MQPKSLSRLLDDMVDSLEDASGEIEKIRKSVSGSRPD